MNSDRLFTVNNRAGPMLTRQTYGRYSQRMKTKRPNKLTVMLSDEEIEALRIRARAAGVDVSTYIRLWIRRMMGEAC